jgi:pyruvate,water dikinase
VETAVQSVSAKIIGSGLPLLDDLLQGLRLEDNVVWQLDSLEDYPFFVEALIKHAMQNDNKCVYIRFAPHAPVVKARYGLVVVNIDPSQGFDYFSGEVFRLIDEMGKGVYFIFDNLSALVDEWATDELLVNFFQITCPHLFEMGDVAYFALRREQHGQSAVSRIRAVTQILIDVYHVSGNKYIHPLKVKGRHSSEMFLPHKMGATEWEPVVRSGEAASVLNAASRNAVSLKKTSIAPWDRVYRRLVHYQGLEKDSPEVNNETALLKDELARMMIGSHRKLIQLSNRYMSVEDLFGIRDRIIGSGRIGGKSAGMLMARAVLSAETDGVSFKQILEEHDSFYIGSDVFFTFLVNNGLFELRLQLSEGKKLSWDDFDDVENRFLSGKFPSDVMEQFKNMLDYYGQAPIIVRSSSLLEDGFNDAFAGKYRSEFCPNQGSPEERLEVFLKAVKLVYASSLNPDALSYRRRRGLDEGDEQMAILVQRVSGMPYKQYFFPTLAGVAFSRNLYAWTDRIDPKKGMIRLVFGLGTRAVNRVSGEYPRMIAVSHPELRPEAGMEVAKYAQRLVDALNLETNKFETLPFNEIIGDRDYPGLNMITSEVDDGYVRDITSSLSSTSSLVLTFNNLIRKTKLVSILREILAKLEQAWDQPIDIEFTAYFNEKGDICINLLQCRALHVPRASGIDVHIPEDVPADKVLFASDRTISAGIVDDIRHIIFIDPREYAEATLDRKRSLGRVVGMLNERLGQIEGRIMAIGPGRWGSNNIDLGVNVTYAEIDNVSVLVEVGREESGLKPELSYGTHFFQDLVESDILYVPVYPGDEKYRFNREFFYNAKNIFTDLLPDYGEFEDLVHVINVPESGSGPARLLADPQTHKAKCILYELRG